MRLLRSSAIVGLFTSASRVLGLVREMLLAAALGAGATTDVFLTAFRVPNLFRRIFAEGAFPFKLSSITWHERGLVGPLAVNPPAQVGES